MMTYYKKGSEVSGTPLIFPLVTNLEESIKNDAANKIYPNPVNEFVILSNAEKISTLYVYDS